MLPLSASRSSFEKVLTYLSFFEKIIHVIYLAPNGAYLFILIFCIVFFQRKGILSQIRRSIIYGQCCQKIRKNQENLH